MTTKQFKAVNGFSNSFWGWGGEDDDMSNRYVQLLYIKRLWNVIEYNKVIDIEPKVPCWIH